MSELIRVQDYKNKNVLIVGGTRGIGLATGIEFARHGAQVWLTHYWSSVPEEDVIAEFKKYGEEILPPKIFQADVSNDEDMWTLMSEMKKTCSQVDVVLISASSMLRIKSVEDYKKNSFLKTIEYGAWPIVGYTVAIEKTFGKYPRYVIGLTVKTGQFYQFYDFHSAAKMAMESLVRYMAARLRKHDCRFNIVCAPFVKTEAPAAVFGDKNSKLLEKIYDLNSLVMTSDEVALSIYGLCSGYFDHFSGQTLSLDSGGFFKDNTMGLLDEGELNEVLQNHYGERP